MTNPRIPNHLQPWIEARKKFHLSHAQVQMARELGMNPKRLGKKANHKQEPWKIPLPLFIERLYRKRFGKDRPDVVTSVEQKVQAEAAKRAARREAKRLRREAQFVADRLRIGAQVNEQDATCKD